VITIRIAQPEDAAAIADVHRVAFPGDAEARFVEALVAEDDALVSLVAVAEDEIIGHVLFSRMGIQGHGGEIAAVALAPIGVKPGWRRRGLAAALVEEGLRLCRERGDRIVLVLGDPGYYRRFGFAPAPGAIERPWPGPHFMALALTPGALDGVAGRVGYPRAFDRLA
jgi:putative acetyltransferase